MGVSQNKKASERDNWNGKYLCFLLKKASLLTWGSWCGVSTRWAL